MGIVFILIYFIIVFIVIEIATVLLILSGLKKDVARFQAISMLTGTGFTTIESELIARHPIRKKIAMFLILFGAFSLAVIISSLSTILAQHSGIPQLSIIAVVMAVGYFIIRSKPVERYLERHLKSNLQKEYMIHELPIEDVLYISRDDLFIEVVIYMHSPFIGKRGSEIAPKTIDMLILFIKRGEEFIRNRAYDTQIREGDTLFVYGNKQVIQGIFGEEISKKEQVKKDATNTTSKLVP
ncbi:TrkA C-terminal domain-containing protein [Aneurinibacillus sp. Ricciae_BoGa-3]|uniref:TrkA C-terminal domain-containing protein n=1 Tax=Aneurinibacillus sp. Ricciae_BoGa-3 TaxID=3022697 RepID=UPI00233F92FB|nr:TrkA C-terminal domain-containing protein [Aneurinibacillus sp. Ricciae_BoGa-3]WCK53525.1 TrkA C-terminal domain-containing protein [Aneurinibacillus sp. Ricciae_BoGa-3]